MPLLSSSVREAAVSLDEVCLTPRPSAAFRAALCSGVSALLLPLLRKEPFSRAFRAARSSGDSVRFPFTLGGAAAWAALRAARCSGVSVDFGVPALATAFSASACCSDDPFTGDPSCEPEAKSGSARGWGVVCWSSGSLPSSSCHRRTLGGPAEGEPARGGRNSLSSSTRGGPSPGGKGLLGGPSGLADPVTFANIFLRIFAVSSGLRLALASLSSIFFRYLFKSGPEGDGGVVELLLFSTVVDVALPPGPVAVIVVRSVLDLTSTALSLDAAPSPDFPLPSMSIVPASAGMPLAHQRVLSGAFDFA